MTGGIAADTGATGQTLSADWSPEVGAFLDYWRLLRGGDRLPTSERFLGQPSPRFASNCYIVELTEQGAMVRYQGTALAERWMRDFTGLELHDRRDPVFKARSLENLSNIVKQPCGYLVRISFSTSTGRKLHSELIQLPLAVKGDRARRIVCFSHSEIGRGWQERVARYIESHRMDWIDIGAGVPVAPPNDLRS